MDTNLYSSKDNLSNNLGDTLVHWIMKVHEIKVYKTKGSARNGQPADRLTGRISVKIKSS